jgi:hypothetical protein
MAAIFAVSSCGGPIIPFRAGRVDAWKAGNLGTPQPQHDIATLTQSFSNQGFNQAEMIKLVVCGHTLGGVRTTDFPQLVSPDSTGKVLVIDNFDQTMQFDNLVLVVFSYFSNAILTPIYQYKQSYGLLQQQYYKHPSHYKHRRQCLKQYVCFGFTRL